MRHKGFLRWMIAILTACSIALAGLGPVAASPSLGTPGLLAQIRKTHVITVAMAVNPPMVLQRPDGSWYGFNPDLVRLLGKAWHVKVQFVAAGWPTIVAGLQANKYDTIGASISATALRKKAISFTRPYFKAGQIFIVNKHNPKHLGSIASLNRPNVTIAFSENTIEGEITKALAPQAQERALPNPSIGDLLAEVESGRSDAFAITSVLRRPIERKFKWARAIPNTDRGVNSTPVAWGVRKENTHLRKALNQFLNKELHNGTIKRLLKRDINPKNSGLG